MDRDFIIVTGNQGFGKSVWTKLYAESRPRFFVFDPKGEYRADFVTAPSEWMEPVINGTTKEFRYGTSLPYELPIYADAAYGVGDCLLVIEECALIFRRGEELQEWARPLVFMGREQRVSLVLVAQRAAKIPLDIRSQASRIVTFRQTEPDDVRTLRERMGEAAEGVPNLSRLTCLDWTPEGVKSYSITPA